MISAASGYSYAQENDSSASLSFSGYVEVYYNDNLYRQPNHTQPAFMYAYNKTHELALNLGYIKASFQTGRVRANIALAAGSYMNANYAAEPGVLKNIYEADAGVKISGKSNLWIDAGVMPSHIGFESAAGKDCWTLTRSIAAESSPYFETGTRLSYTSRNNKWYLAVLLLNGWQRIEMTAGNNMPSFGHQVTFKPNDRLTLNSSSFIGSDKPDSAHQWRFFHDLYMQYQPGKAFGFIAGLDIGAAQKMKESRSYNCWYAPVIIGKYAMSDRSSVAIRAEYYRDKNGAVIATALPDGFGVFGYSVNYDLKIGAHALWRIEARGFSGKDNLFINDGIPVKNDLFFTTSLAVSL